MTVIEQIKTKLEELRALDRDITIFGAKFGHKYQFRPCLAEDEALAFERKHAIELPKDYRAFLTEMGNGGAGPSYGVFPLGIWDGPGTDEPWDSRFVGKLSDPFPHRQKWNPAKIRGEGDEEPTEEEEAAEFDPAMMAGAFPICHHGCALRSWLVVSGPERGTVWYDARADDRGVRPEVDADGKHLTFSY